MTAYRLTLLARRDLIAIWSYIAEQSSERRADNILTELRDAMRELARHPHMGHVRDDLADESLRVWTVHSFLIVYRPEQDPLEVIRVVHGSRDLLRMFGI